MILLLLSVRNLSLRHERQVIDFLREQFSRVNATLAEVKGTARTALRALAGVRCGETKHAGRTFDRVLDRLDRIERRLDLRDA